MEQPKHIEYLQQTIKQTRALLKLQERHLTEMTDCAQKSLFDANEGKKEASINLQAARVIEHLSQHRIKEKLSDKDLKKSDSRIQSVADRLKESSFEEAIKMIDTKLFDWRGKDQIEYFTIETMFRKSKYFKYVDDIPRIVAKMKAENWTEKSSAQGVQSWTDV